MELACYLLALSTIVVSKIVYESPHSIRLERLVRSEFEPVAKMNMLCFPRSHSKRKQSTDSDDLIHGSAPLETSRARVRSCSAGQSQTFRTCPLRQSKPSRAARLGILSTVHQHSRETTGMTGNRHTASVRNFTRWHERLRDARAHPLSSFFTCRRPLFRRASSSSESSSAKHKHNREGKHNNQHYPETKQE